MTDDDVKFSIDEAIRFNELAFHVYGSDNVTKPAFCKDCQRSLNTWELLCETCGGDNFWISN